MESPEIKYRIDWVQTVYPVLNNFPEAGRATVMVTTGNSIVKRMEFVGNAILVHLKNGKLRFIPEGNIKEVEATAYIDKPEVKVPGKPAPQPQPKKKLPVKKSAKRK